jgi:hypothetical protein
MKYAQVLTIHGDGVATAYVREGWEIVATHLYEQVKSRNRNGQPTSVEILTVYIIGRPESVSVTSSVQTTRAAAPAGSANPTPTPTPASTTPSTTDAELVASPPNPLHQALTSGFIEDLRRAGMKV